MKWKPTLIFAVLLLSLAVTPASALEYTIDAPSAGDFGSPTSDETVYVGTEATANVDRSKNSALIPPGFGSPTSYLPGSGEHLTPNLAANGNPVSVTNPSSGVVVTSAGTAGGAAAYPGAADVSTSTFTTTAYTSVTTDLYYSGGHLGTLAIPSIGVNVKIYQGTDSATLAKGAGHFDNTSIYDGNVCVAAHNRGTNSYFGKIHKLTEGDTITLTTKLGTRTYAVTSVEKISETDNTMLASTSENCITLFTCVQDERDYRWCVRAVEN